MVKSNVLIVGARKVKSMLQKIHDRLTAPVSRAQLSAKL